MFSTYIVNQLTEVTKSSHVRASSEFTKQVPEAAEWTPNPTNLLNKGLDGDDVDEVSVTHALNFLIFTWQSRVFPPGTSERYKAVLRCLRHWIIEFGRNFRTSREGNEIKSHTLAAYIRVIQRCFKTVRGYDIDLLRGPTLEKGLCTGFYTK